MKCKNCKTVLEAGQERCPNCGAEVAQAKGMSAGQITLLVVLGVVALAVVLALVIGALNPKDVDPTEPSTEPSVATVPDDGNSEDVTCKGSYTVSADQVASTRDTVVARIGDNELTNGELQLNYWYTFYNFVYTYSNMGLMDYIGLNQTQPLDTQVSIDGDTTWQQFFLRDALNNWHSYVALAMEAENAGFKLPADQQALLDANVNPDNLLASAQNGGFATVEEMLANDMGPGVTVEEYTEFMTLFYTSAQYLTSVTSSFELTEDEVSAFFDEKADSYASGGIEKNDDKYATVRHILISVTPSTDAETNQVVYTDEAWDDCLKAAQQVMDEWKKDPTEENFAKLAGIYSDDGGSNTNGGLYADFAEGYMIAEFNDWCFDEARQYGDSDLVKTDYGYHLMFFVETRPVWYVAAETDLMSEKSVEYLDQIQDKYPIEVDYESIAFADAAFLTASSEE